MRGQVAQQYGSGNGGGDQPDHGGQDSAFREGRPNRLDAQRGGSARQVGGVGMLLRHAEELSLTEDQQDGLEKLKVSHELEKVDNRAAISKARIRLRAVMRDYDSAESDVIAAIDELSRCEANLRKMRYSHLRAARAVLNQDQTGKLKSFHRNRIQERMKTLSLVRQSGAQ